VQVHYIAENKDGSKTIIKAGRITAGDTKVIKSHAITNESTLKQMADAKLKKLSYDGYEGKIKTFGIPYCEPGYRAILEDKKYPGRNGNYLIESVEITYGMTGYRRIVGIGAKL